MARFDDCESCAFYGVEQAICDICEDADQWEDADADDLSYHKGDAKKVRDNVFQLSRMKKAA